MSNKKLDDYLVNYTKFNNWLIERRYNYLKKYFHGESCLELGSAEGAGTPYLLDYFNEVTIVDGSLEAVEAVLKKNRKYSHKLTGVHTLFEDIDFGGRTFDTIVLAHILEHVDDPVGVLKIAKSLLNKNGRIIVDVPNGNSLHRQIGVKMGLLNKCTELNSADLSIGHQRVYTPETFVSDIEESRLKVDELGGMFIKVTSNSETENFFNTKQLEAMFMVGVDNPDISAELYAVCKI